MYTAERCDVSQKTVTSEQRQSVAYYERRGSGEPCDNQEEYSVNDDGGETINAG